MDASRRFQASPIATLSTLALILLTAAGCASATAWPDGSGVRADAAVGSELDPPGTRYATVDEAAIAALAHAAATTRRSDLDRLRVGSVVGVAGAYTWTWQTTPRERAGSRDDWRPKARVSLTADHVAMFVMHPRTGERSIDRANEEITRGERRIVDDLDPLHRPIYLLTPSGRVVSYHHGDTARAIADLRSPRRSRATVASGARPRALANEADSDAKPGTGGVVLADGLSAR